MFELISLLAQQSPKQVATGSTTPTETAPELQVQSQTPPITPAPFVAIPETTAVESAIPQNSPPVENPEPVPPLATVPVQRNPNSIESTLPPQPTSTPAITSRVSLPQVQPLPKPEPATKPLNKPAIKVPSTKIAQTNSLNNKPKLTSEKKVVAPTTSATPNNRIAANSVDSSQVKTTEAKPTLPTVPNLFNPKTRSSSVEPAKPPQTAVVVETSKQPKAVSSNRELVFDAPTLPSEAMKDSLRNQLQPSPQAVSSRDVEASNPEKLPAPNSATPETASARIERQQKLLEQRLAEIVAKERAEKQAKQQQPQIQPPSAQNPVQSPSAQNQDALVNEVYSQVTQRRFDRARQLAQNPAIAAEVRTRLMTEINDLERASRLTGNPNPTPPKQAIAPVNRTPVNQPNLSSVPRLPQQLPQPRTIVRIPGENNLPNSPLRPQQIVIESTQSDETLDSVGSVNTPVPQGLNPNLANFGNSKDQIVYPLPEPVPVTSRFGWRVHPVTRVRRFHAGVDLGAAHGTPVLASRGGRVVSADRLGGYGLAVVMQHSDGTQDTLYAHLSQIFVRPGERIQPGTVIGRVGSTGLSTGPHLHYEARRKANTGWVAVDPGAQIEAARLRLVQARQNPRS